MCLGHLCCCVEYLLKQDLVLGRLKVVEPTGVPHEYMSYAV